VQVLSKSMLPHSICVLHEGMFDFDMVNPPPTSL